MKGIDVSYFQGKIDWIKVRNDGIGFAIIREGFRQKMDTRFLDNVQGCQNAGIPVFGIYHFIYAMTEDQAKLEAQSCLASIRKAGLKDIIVFSDFEYDTINKAKLAGVILGRNECNRFTKIFLNTIAAAGYKTGIYLNNDYYKNMYDTDLLNQHTVWLADYNGQPDHPCKFRQYTSSGIVSGINGNVDLDSFNELKGVKTTVEALTDFSKYNGLLSNSGHDERGIYSGGKAGDQTGTEWMLCKWYNRPWNCVIRFTDSTVARMMATLSIYAAQNNLIGYDQGERTSYWKHLQLSNYDPRQITIACEDDCSAGVLANAKAALILTGHQDAANKVNVNGYTGNMKQILQGTGMVKVFTDKSYLNGTSMLQPGDILLNESHHTACYVGSAASTSGGTVTTSKPASSGSGAPSKTVKYTGVVTVDSLNVRLQPTTSAGKCSFSPLAQGTEIGVCDTMSNGWLYIQYNGKFGFVSGQYVKKKETAAVSRPASSAKVAAAALFNKSIAGTYTVTAGALNLRSSAAIKAGNIIGCIPHGTVIRCYGYLTKAGGTDWYLIQLQNGQTGYVSSRYLARR